MKVDYHGSRRHLDKKINTGHEQRWGRLPTVTYLRFFDHHTDIWRWTIKLTIGCVRASVAYRPWRLSLPMMLWKHSTFLRRVWLNTNKWMNCLAFLRARRCIWPSVVHHHVMEPAWSSYIDGIARTTNVVEGWHHGLQSLFDCHHPTMWTLLAGIIFKQKALLLQAATGVVHPPKKIYSRLQKRVEALKQRLWHTVELKSWCFFVQCRICLTRNCEMLNSWFFAVNYVWNVAVSNVVGLYVVGIKCRRDYLS